jgi:SAM-dependent methyltransferase
MSDVWTGRAEAYRTAVEQASGEDLDLIARWSRDEADGGTALDVATGGGHVTRRLREAGLQVTSLDPAPGMQPDVVARAEHIPFADSSFDIVLTRIAPHHFEDVRAAVVEMGRVARRLVIVEDTLYADDTVEEAERVRDPTHVRSYTEAEWRGFLEGAGLDVEALERFEKRHPLEAWLARTGCEGEEADRVRSLLADRIVEGHYVDEKIVLKARKS